MVTVMIIVTMHINMNFRQPSPQEAALPQRIAGNIRELRRIRHLTQAELARRVGMRPETDGVRL